MNRPLLLVPRVALALAWGLSFAACGDPPPTPPDAPPPDLTPSDVATLDVADATPPPDALDAAPADASPDATPDVSDRPTPDAAPDAPVIDVALDVVPDRAAPDAPPLDAPRVDAAASCDAGLAACGASCVNLMADRNHCGACGVSCCPGALCVNGRCFADCMAGRTPCVLPGAPCHTCIDLTSDARHCGACNRACAEGQTCVAGACRCPTVTEPPSPMGVCDGRGRIACQMWAQGLAGGNPSAVATCLTSPSGCARADSCSDLRDPSTCRCGASPACGAGQVCVLSGPTARCVCATP